MYVCKKAVLKVSQVSSQVCRNGLESPVSHVNLKNAFVPIYSGYRQTLFDCTYTRHRIIKFRVRKYIGRCPGAEEV